MLVTTVAGGLLALVAFLGQLPAFRRVLRNGQNRLNAGACPIDFFGPTALFSQVFFRNGQNKLKESVDIEERMLMFIGNAEHLVLVLGVLASFFAACD